MQFLASWRRVEADDVLFEVFGSLGFDELIEVVGGQVWPQGHHAVGQWQVLIALLQLFEVQVQFVVVPGLHHRKHLDEEPAPPLQSIPLQARHLQLALQLLASRLPLMLGRHDELLLILERQCHWAFSACEGEWHVEGDVRRRSGDVEGDVDVATGAGGCEEENEN